MHSNKLLKELLAHSYKTEKELLQLIYECFREIFKQHSNLAIAMLDDELSVGMEVDGFLRRLSYFKRNVGHPLCSQHVKAEEADANEESGEEGND